jgi:hypothetical protein
MADTDRAPITAEDLEDERISAAYHEAAHVVIAAVLGLRLRTEGVMIDTAAKGLGCYCKDPGESNALREHVMLTTFAGFFAQNRFLKERAYPQVEYLQLIWSEDWREARGIASKLSNEYLATRGILTTQEELEQRSDQLVAENWRAIEFVASVLLTKEWEPLKPLKSGSQWSKQSLAKYLSGEEVVQILEQFGITAVSVSDC